MEEHSVIIGLGSIIVLGISAQWLAMRMHLPSILFLLIFGFVAGPVTGFLHVDALMGHLLFPFISLSVAIILFEGGMDLKFAELRGIGRMVRNMISIGVLVTWVLTSCAAYYVLEINFALSVLLGSIFVVTGPTVIGPLLRHVRPAGRVGNIVKWEGIMNDPIGVLLTVLIFECMLASDIQSASLLVIFGLLKTVFLSSLVGLGCAWVLIFFLKRYWIPDSLHQVVTLMFVVIAFVIANILQVESGLLAVTLMGIMMANQKQVSIQHILEFKENLRVLIISILFILLSARLDLENLSLLNGRSFIFLALLFFVIRPLCVLISARGLKLNWKEKLFISWMAPRGIVAAAVASIFTFELQEVGYPQTEMLVPITFFVIISTVAIYGLSAAPLARALGLATANPQGVLILGAHAWGRSLAKEIRDLGFKVILIDTNRFNVKSAKRMGLKAYEGNFLQESVYEELDLEGIGRCFALTPNDEANSLATVHFRDEFGQANVYQIAIDHTEVEELDESSPTHLRGRKLFSQLTNFNSISKKFTEGWKLQHIQITEDYTFEKFKEEYQGRFVNIFLIEDETQLHIFAQDNPPEPKTGQVLVSLIQEER